MFALLFSSCDGVIPDSGKTTKELDTDEQKEKLEQAGLKLMDECPADELESYLNLVDSFNTAYMNDNYDIDALIEFAANSSDKAFSEDVSAVYNEMTQTYVMESFYNLAVVLADHEGEFTFGADGVVLIDTLNVDGTKVNFALNGKNYVAQIKSSGKTTRAFYSYVKHLEENEYGYIDKDGNWIYVDEKVASVYDYQMDLSIDIPEKIEISLVEDGNPKVSIVLGFTQSITAAGLDPSTDNFNVNMSVVLDNGYEMTLDMLAYDGKTQTAGAGMVFKKDGQTLISGQASGSVQVENDTREHTEGYNSSVKLVKAKDLEILIDFLGEVQFKGQCSNAKELSESLDAYWDALSRYDDNGRNKNIDENEALRHLNNANAKLDFNVYYDGGSNSQAKVELEMDKRQYDWDYNNDGVINADDIHYGLNYVIVFNDGSRYSVDEYFDDSSFSLLIGRFDSFADEYEDLFGVYFEDQVRDEVEIM